MIKSMMMSMIMLLSMILVTCRENPQEVNQVERSPRPFPTQAPVINRIVAEPDMIILDDDITTNDSTVVRCEASYAEGPLENNRIIFSWAAQNGILVAQESRYDSLAIVTGKGGDILLTCEVQNPYICISGPDCSFEDLERGAASKSRVIKVIGERPVNMLPVIESLTVDKDPVIVGEIATLTCIASDTEGDSLIYQWESFGISQGTFTETGLPNRIEWHTQEPGDYQIRCTVLEAEITGFRPNVRSSLFIHVEQ